MFSRFLRRLFSRKPVVGDTWKDRVAPYFTVFVVENVNGVVKFTEQHRSMTIFGQLPLDDFLLFYEFQSEFRGTPNQGA